MFKNRLQEYAQKAALPSPLYGFVKDGAPHQPRFKATVSVNGVSYESAPGHHNLKSAEQAAAKVALEHLQGGDGVTPAPVFESGLYKSLLQEHVQKAKLPLPAYVVLKTNKGQFTATVEIGGVTYRGAEARNRKEAEIKAARSAVLAIQSRPASSVEAGAPGSAPAPAPVHPSNNWKKRGRQPAEPADYPARGEKQHQPTPPAAAAHRAMASQMHEAYWPTSDARTDGRQHVEALDTQQFIRGLLGRELGYGHLSSVPCPDLQPPSAGALQQENAYPSIPHHYPPQLVSPMWALGQPHAVPHSYHPAFMPSPGVHGPIGVAHHMHEHIMSHLGHQQGLKQSRPQHFWQQDADTLCNENFIQRLADRSPEESWDELE